MPVVEIRWALAATIVSWCLLPLCAGNVVFFEGFTVQLPLWFQLVLHPGKPELLPYKESLGPDHAMVEGYESPGYMEQPHYGGYEGFGPDYSGMYHPGAGHRQGLYPVYHHRTEGPYPQGPPQHHPGPYPPHRPFAPPAPHPPQPFLTPPLPPQLQPGPLHHQLFPPPTQSFQSTQSSPQYEPMGGPQPQPAPAAQGGTTATANVAAPQIPQDSAQKPETTSQTTTAESRNIEIYYPEHDYDGYYYQYR